MCAVVCLIFVACIISLVPTSILYAANSSERISAIEKRQQFLDKFCIGICPKSPVGTDDIKDGAVTTPKLADNAVSTDKVADGAITAEKINGLEKLFFGSCSGTLPPIEPGGMTWEVLVCDVPAGAVVGDKVVASSTVRGVPSPVLVLSEILHTQPPSRPLDDYLIFAFVNGAEFPTPEQEVTVSYIIFNQT